MYCQALILIAFVDLVVSRDFTIGMFRDTDILVTQDIVYKERSPFRETTLKYGKTFACSITYFRIADRLGYGDGPKVKVIRGGLQKKYIVVKLWTYNLPIAVNVQAGCKAPPKTTKGKVKDKEEKSDEDSDNKTESDSENDSDDSSTKTDDESAEQQADEIEAEEEKEEKEKKEEKEEKEATTEAEGDEGEGEANENESLRRKNLNIV